MADSSSDFERFMSDFGAAEEDAMRLAERELQASQQAVATQRLVDQEKEFSRQAVRMGLSTEAANRYVDEQMAKVAPQNPAFQISPKAPSTPKQELQDLSAFEGAERGASSRTFAQDFLRNRMAAQGGPSVYTPRVFGPDPKFERQREAARRNFELQAAELNQMVEDDRMVKAREQKDVALKNLQAAEETIQTYKPTDQGPMSSTGSKVAAAIAIALGEAARGFRGGQGANIGMDLINQAIDREAKRQQDEYNRLKDRVNFTNNVYGRAFQEFGSAEAAFETAKAALWNRAVQTTNVQLGVIRDNAAADKIRKDALNAAELQKSRAFAAAQTAGKSKGLGEKQKLAADQQMASSRAAAKQIRTAKNSLSKIKDRDSFSTKFTQILAAQADDPGLIKQSSRILLGTLSEDGQRLINFYNDINAIAFDLAKQGQSASSISNADVQIFRNLLANPAVSQAKIDDYLDYLGDKAAANAVFNELIVGDVPIREARQVADQYMINELGYDQSPDGTFSKGEFNRNEYDQFLMTQRPGG